MKWVSLWLLNFWASCWLGLLKQVPQPSPSAHPAPLLPSAARCDGEKRCWVQAWETHLLSAEHALIHQVGGNRSECTWAGWAAQPGQRERSSRTPARLARCHCPQRFQDVVKCSLTGRGALLHRCFHSRPGRLCFSATSDTLLPREFPLSLLFIGDKRLS